MARTGFEPVISALRGRRPGPLDERAILPTVPTDFRLAREGAGRRGIRVGFGRRGMDPGGRGAVSEKSLINPKGFNSTVEVHYTGSVGTCQTVVSGGEGGAEVVSGARAARR